MFGSSVFICLGVCLVLFGIFGYLISIKLNEQNDKIKNMFDLICTITNDLQLIKLHQSTSNIITNNTTNPLVFSGGDGDDSNSNSDRSSKNIIKSLDNHYISSSLNNKIDTLFFDEIHSDIKNGNSIGSICSGGGNGRKKIVVSDDDDDDEDNDEDRNSDEDSDDDDEDDSDTDHNNEDNDDDLESVNSKSDTENSENKSFDDCSVDGMSSSMDLSESLSKNLNYKEVDIKSIHLEKLDSLINEYISKPDFELELSTLPDSVPTNLSNDIIQCVLIDESELKPDPDQTHEDQETKSLPTEDTKTIIVDLNTEPSPDYHKMTIHQLRKIAIERNLIDSSSKLKKNDLLKLF